MSGVTGKKIFTTCRNVLGAALIALFIFLFASWNADPAQRTAPPAAPALAVYKDLKNGFEVTYDAALLDFRENFDITPMPSRWLCKSYAKFAEETLFSERPPDMQCHRPKFFEFIDYIAPRGMRATFTTKTENNVAVLYSETPTTSLTDSKKGTLETYRIFVEAPAGKKEWVLDIYMVPRKGTLLCKDNVCDIGEDKDSNLAYCPTDCPTPKDWTAIVKETFSTLTFTQQSMVR